jgi:putative hemolysin
MLAATFGALDALTLAGIAGLLVALCGLAVAETSLNRITPVKARSIHDTQPTASSAALLGLVSRPEGFINPVLVATTTCQTAQAFLTSLLAARLFGALGVAVGFVINVVVFFVLTEALPKTWAIMSSERAALAIARPIARLVAIAPIEWISRGLIGLTNVLIPGRGLARGPFVTEHELLGIVDEAAHDRVIEFEERDMIENIIEFGDAVAGEAMTLRKDMVVVPSGATVDSALDVAVESGFSRLPVRANDGLIGGVVHVKDLLTAQRAGWGGHRALEVAAPLRTVGTASPLALVMREMQAERFHLAVVIEPNGGDVLGLITLEDCLEELVGEIEDEHDLDE